MKTLLLLTLALSSTPAMAYHNDYQGSADNVAHEESVMRSRMIEMENDNRRAMDNLRRENENSLRSNQGDALPVINNQRTYDETPTTTSDSSDFRYHPSKWDGRR